MVVMICMEVKSKTLFIHAGPLYGYMGSTYLGKRQVHVDFAEGPRAHIPHLLPRLLRAVRLPENAHHVVRFGEKGGLQ